VFFDNFTVSVSESQLVQLIDYYPYGMVSSQWERTGEKVTRELFQGKTYEQLSQLADFHARHYDAALGRWHAVDPANQFASPYTGMANNPVMSIDPDGRLAWFVPMIVGAVIGGVSQGIASVNAGGTFLGGFWRGALVGGAAGFAAVGATAAIAGTTLAGTASAGLGANIAGGAIGGSLNGAGFAALNGGDVGRGLWTGALGGAIASGASIGAGKLLGNGGGFIDGFARGALSGGATGGVNAILSGQDIGRGIWQGAAIGGAIGGAFAGVEARKAGARFFSGKKTFDISNGVGAHNISNATPSIFDAKYKGKFEGVNVFETEKLGYGRYSGGITLPKTGIIVGQGVFSRGLYPELMQHEFGHILQARRVGVGTFYGIIGKESLLSAAFSHSHNTYWTETWANYLSQQYFGSAYIPSAQFPVQDISWWKQFRLYFSPWQ